MSIFLFRHENFCWVYNCLRCVNNLDACVTDLGPRSSFNTGIRSVVVHSTYTHGSTFGFDIFFVFLPLALASIIVYSIESCQVRLHTLGLLTTPNGNIHTTARQKTRSKKKPEQKRKEVIKVCYSCLEP